MFIVKQNRPSERLDFDIKAFKIGSLPENLSNAVIRVSVKINWYIEMGKC